jgi:hypothetical protein
VWGDWFCLAATVITGIRPRLGSEPELSYAGETIGCTFGPISLFASWFVIDEKVRQKGSWKVSQVMGVPQDFTGDQTFFKPQVTNGAMLGRIPDPMQIGVNQHEYTVSDSGLNLKMQTAVLQVSSYLCRIMTLIGTGETMRCLNPHDIYWSQVHAHRPTCTHRGNSTSHTVHGWGLTDILQQWYQGNVKTEGKAHVALVGDSVLQHNIAAAFAGENCVIQSSECCFQCAVQFALSEKAVLIPSRKPRGRSSVIDTV